MGFPGKGPIAVITDLGILTPDPDHQGADVDQRSSGRDGGASDRITGWPLKVAHKVVTTPPPNATELAVLRDLQQRTARAHAGQA